MSNTDGPVPTAQEAVKLAVENFTDKDTVAAVQKALLAKGYVDGGPADGELSQKTKDEILTFRARNNLPLVPVIDSELIRALETAPMKALPVEQVTATKAEIAPKVEVVAKTEKVVNSAWWTKLWAFVTGIPAGLFTLLGAVISNLDEASEMVAPLKALFYEVHAINPFVWIGLIAVVALVLGWQAMTISKLSKQVEEAAVEGYQRGTIKNDIPPKEDA